MTHTAFAAISQYETYARKGTQQFNAATHTGSGARREKLEHTLMHEWSKDGRAVLPYVAFRMQLCERCSNELFLAQTTMLSMPNKTLFKHVFISLSLLHHVGRAILSCNHTQ